MPIIEHAPSNRSSCRICKKKIKKHKLRYCEGYEKYYSQKWHHIKCYGNKWAVNSNRIISAEDKHYIRGWKKLCASEKLKVRKLFWPNEVDDNIKLSLRLPKEIDNMTVKELKLELQKRGKSIKPPNRRDIFLENGIKRNVSNKILLQERLKQYFISNKNKLIPYQMKDNQKLVTGYIKTESKIFKIQIPTVIVGLILTFCPYQKLN